MPPGAAVRFDLAVPGDVRVGAGRLAEVPQACTALGVTRVLVVTGSTPGRADHLRALLTAAGLESVTTTVAGEPGVTDVRAGVALAREAGADGVVGFGGGSPLDVAKAVAALAATGADPLDHLEVVGHGLPLPDTALPCVAVPTTAGTGAEVTRNAVLRADGPDGPVKVSLRGPQLLPRVAVVDPDLLAGLPRGTLVAGGMDALTQLVEPFLSVRATPVTDALAREGLRRSARSLAAAARDGLDGDDAAGRRDDLAVASLLGGLCLANAGLGVVHGFAGVVGGRYRAPHGAVCAALLVPGLRVTLRALREREPANPALAKAAELGPLLTGRSGTDADDALAWLTALVAELGVPPLSAWGATDDDVPVLAAGAARASSTRANPLPLNAAELEEIAATAVHGGDPT